MARMLGVCQRPWCPSCHRPAGVDCCVVASTKKAACAREKRAWRREVEDEN